MKKIALLYFLILIGLKNFGFDLHTHLWISQQVLNDIIKNRSVTLNKKVYSLTDEVRNALIAHPSEFRMGTLGPDVFPDPVVGQITAHPGLPNGWKTDDWIKYVLNAASSPVEIAFAYGYACHAAMDIFAHSYVNAYSGDIFLLTDETAVERRHFALEKYIGNHLPRLLSADGQIITNKASLISAPENFLSKAFILNNSVMEQYVKSGSLHLVAMNGVYNLVKKLDEGNQNIVALLSSTYLKYLKEQQRLVLELDKKVGLTAQAGIQLKLAKEALDIKIAANNLLLAKIKIERDIINKGIETKKDIERFLQQKHKIIEDANSLIAGLENQLIDKEAQIAKLATDIGLLPLTISKEIVETITKWIPAIPYPCGITTCSGPLGVRYPCPKICNTKLITEIIRKTIQIANPAIEELTKKKNQLIDQVANAKKQIVKSRSDVVSATNDIVAKTEELKNLVTNIALSEANELNYKAQKELLEKEIKVLQAAYDNAKKIYETVKKEENELRGRLEAFVDQFINLAQRLIEKYNLVHLILKNWERDIEKASRNYIAAGKEFAGDILSGNGNGFSRYTEWYKCWSPVFTAIPGEIPQAACAVLNYYDQINAEIDKILDQLGPLKYLIDPTRKLKEYLKEEAKEKLEYAATHISNYIFGKQTTDFFLLVTGREAVTTQKLIDIYKEDGSGKNLVTFENITTVINKEMGIGDDSQPLDAEKFAALYNAIVLSRMSLLPATSLNKIHADYLGNARTVYGKTLYPETQDNRFTILYRAVSVIDGSSQWMNTALPLYRTTGFDQKWPADRRYGYSRCSDKSNGFRFWVDTRSRKKIFNVLFKGPLYPELYASCQNNTENGRFAPCVKNPFPNTEIKDCTVLHTDTDCSDSWFKKLLKPLFGRK